MIDPPGRLQLSTYHHERCNQNPRRRHCLKPFGEEPRQIKHVFVCYMQGVLCSRPTFRSFNLGFPGLAQYGMFPGSARVSKSLQVQGVSGNFPSGATGNLCGRAESVWRLRFAIFVPFSLAV